MPIPVAVATLRFEDLSCGDEVGFEHNLTTADIDAFAALSGDISPLHMSDDFARSRGFPGRVAHGALLSAYVSRLFGVYLPGQDCILQSVSLKYLQPAHGGDHLTFTARIGQKSELVRSLTAEVTVTNALGILVAKGKVQFGFTSETA